MSISRAGAITGQGQPHRRISGRVVARPGVEREGLVVALYRDGALGAQVGSATTDANGAFSADLTVADGRRVWGKVDVSGIAARTPVLDPWTQASRTLELFALDTELARELPQGSEARLVSVVESDGRPPLLGTYSVTLVERTARACVVHDRAPLPASGRVIVRVRSDLQFARAERDLFVRLETMDGTPIHDSHATEIRLPAQLATRDFELSRVAAAIRVAGVTAGELSDDDIDYIAHRTGLPRALTRTARAAARLGNQLGISLPASYGWLRGAAAGTEDVHAALSRARQHKIARPPDDTEVRALIDAFDAARRETALARRGRFGGDTLDEILLPQLPDPQVRAEFAVDYHRRSNQPSLWHDWSSRLDPATIASLQFTTEIARLADHAGLVRALDAERARGKIIDVASLAAWSPNRWANFFSDNKIEAPGAFGVVVGDESAAARLYGERLAIELSLRAPTVALKAALDERLDAFPAWARPVRAFLRSRPEHRFELNPNGAAIAEDHPALPGLRAIFRLLRLPVPAWQVSSFLSKNLTSARDIARLAPASYLRRLGATSSSTAVVGLLDIHDRAVAAATKAVLVRASLGRARPIGPRGILSPAVPPPVSPRQPRISWDSLFGDGDRARCACATCRSVYSPAAYLVSLLETLDAHPKGPAGSTPGSSNAGGMTVESLAELFLERRRDAHALLLTCENSNVPVPTIDLVNELLEELASAAPPPAAPPPAPTVCQSASTAGSAAERRAEPQRLTAPANVGLGQATMPWTLPYSVERHRGLLALEQLGAPLYEIGDVVADLELAADARPPGLPARPPSASDVAADLLRARNILGASEAEWKVLHEPVVDPSRTPAYWPTSIQPGLTPARDLMNATGLSFNDLFTLVATHFVRGGTAVTNTGIRFVARAKAAVDTCAIDELDAVDLSWEQLDRLHRFVRLMRLTMLTAEELDDLLVVLGATTANAAALTEAVLVAVAHAVGIGRRAKRAMVELLPLFGHVVDIKPIRGRLPDERPISVFEKVFDRSARVLAHAIQSVTGPQQAEAATTTLGGLGELESDDAGRVAEAMLGKTNLGTAMASAAGITFLGTSARRVSLLASLAGIDVEAVLALWRLSGLELLVAPPGPVSTLDLPVIIWRFLRFARSTQGWALPASEVAWICHPAIAPRRRGDPSDVGAALIELARSFDALEAELPAQAAPSREALGALLARIVSPTGKTGEDPGDVAAVVEVVDALPFGLAQAGGLAALDPAVVATLDLPGFIDATKTELPTKVAAAASPSFSLAVSHLAGPIEALVPIPPGTAPAAVPPPSLDQRRRDLEVAIEDGVEQLARAEACDEGLGADRMVAAYRVAADPVLGKVRAAVEAGTVEARVAELAQVIATVDQSAAAPPSSTARAAAEAVIAAFLRQLRNAVARGERALEETVAGAAQRARAYAYDRLRGHLLALRRDAAAIQWLSARLGLDQGRTALLVRDLLPHPRDPARPMLAALTEDGGARVREALVRATYSNHLPAAPGVSTYEESLDRAWGGEPPAPGVSGTAFAARFTLGPITLAAQEVIAVRTTFELRELMIMPPAGNPVLVALTSGAGWVDVYTASADGVLDLALVLGPSNAAGSVLPRVEVRRTALGSPPAPLASDARRDLEADLQAIDRAAVVMRAFPTFDAETWSRLERGHAPRLAIALADLVGSASAPSWLTSYRRLEALRVLRERSGAAEIWSTYLDARGSSAIDEATWAAVQGLSTVEASARRSMFEQSTAGGITHDELVLAAGDAVAALAEQATLPPAALVMIGLGPVPSQLTVPRKPPSDVELDAFAVAAVRGQQPARRARELLQAVHDPVRLRYRDALVAWLLHREAQIPSAPLRRFSDATSLNQYLLTDTLVSCCDATSRVQFACAGVQAFVEGVLDRSIQPAGTAVGYWLASLEVLDREWTWKKHYRLFEANLNLFLTPENWLEDETRGDETHAFRELREVLRQGELTTPAAERAVTAYLRRLHELSRLEIVATVTHSGDDEIIPLGFRRTELIGTHVIGRTRSLPARYFYRYRLPSPEARWLPWEPIEVDVEGEAFDLMIHGGRLWFLWATLRPGPEPATELDADATVAKNARPVGETFVAPTVKHAVRLHWLDRVHGAWQGRASAPASIKVPPLAPADITPDVFRFALRSRSERDRLIVHPIWRCLGDAPSTQAETVPAGLVPLHRWYHPLIRTTYLSTTGPVAGGFSLELLTLAGRLRASEAILVWPTFQHTGTVGYVLPPGSTHPGAIDLVPLINPDSGDIFYATDPAEQNLGAPWIRLPATGKVLPSATATTYTRPLRRFYVRQSLPLNEQPDKRWYAHHYGISEPPNFKNPPDNEEGAGECLIWTTDQVIDAPQPERTAQWRGAQAFDLGPAGDVTIRDATMPANLAYGQTGDLRTDGLGYLAPHGGQPLHLPLGGKLREALGDMGPVYRIVMETAHGRSAESEEPRFVDELRAQTREEGGGDRVGNAPLHTFFCERVQVPGLKTDIAPGGFGEVDFDCIEHGLHEIGFGNTRGGPFDGGFTDPLPLFRTDRLHAAMVDAHRSAMRPGPRAAMLLDAVADIGGPTRLGFRPDRGGNIGGFLPPPRGTGVVGGPVVIPDELPLPGPGEVGTMGGFDIGMGWDPRQCITGGLGGRTLANRIAALTRRASFFLDLKALPANALSLLGLLAVTTTTRERWVIRTFQQPFTAALFGRLAASATPGLMELAATQDPVPFLSLYDPVADVLAGAPTWNVNTGWVSGGVLEPRDELDYSDTGAFGDYNWELTYHAPMLVGRRLTQLGRFEDARRWFNLVFDPHAAGTNPREAFRCRPLRDAANQSTVDVLERLADPALSDEALLRQIRRFTNEPFRPHLIARSRPVAYAKATLIAYIEMLIAWGDSLFRTDDRTTIEEARRRYEEAERLLGEVPEVLPSRVVVAPTCYTQLEAAGRTGSHVIDPLVELEGVVQPGGVEAAGAVSGAVPGGASLTLYFCFPGNDRFDALKAKIADRLLKIRACQNLEGIERALSLYGNKIDPGLIARAVAAGVSPADVFQELNAPLPRFRFKELIQRAKEVCADARALGQAMLASLEKNDGEAQQQLRSEHELSTLKNLRQTRAKQLEEATRAKDATDAAKGPIEARQLFYSTREFMNSDEKAASDLTWAAMGVRAAAAAAGFIASNISVAPDFTQGVHAQLMASGPSTLTAVGGGNKAATVFQTVQAAANLTADVLGTVAGNTREQGSYRRRQEDWSLQADLAGKELATLEKQSAAAAVRAAIAQVEVDNHEAQIGQAEASREFLRGKFTNRELYGWMSSRLAGLYYEQFRLAYETVLQAQRAWQYELGTDERPVMGSPWEPGKKGLLAADELMARIHQLEIRFDQKKPYDHAKSPEIRLSEVAPRALIQLRNTGVCEFEIPEQYFDSIEPGGCFRRWKGMAVTIPCVRGPSAVLDGRLTLLAHSRRAQPGRGASAAARPEDPDALLKGVDGSLTFEVGGRDYIELTHGNRDLGLPETAGQEGWRLPFEGTGAISRWRLELPLETNTFDRRSLTDVVLHTVYTARNGSPQDRAAARSTARDWPKEVLLDIPALFPEEWHKFKTTGALELILRQNHFPRRGAVPAAVAVFIVTSPDLRTVKVAVSGTSGAASAWRQNRILGAIEGAATLTWERGDSAGAAAPWRLEVKASDASMTSCLWLVASNR